MNEFPSFDHLFDAVIVINLKREIVYFNNQACIYFKLPPRLMKQKNQIIQICDSFDFDFEGWLSKSVLSFDVMISPEIKLQLPHDSDTEYYCTIKLIPVESGKGTNIAVVFHDTTVEKNLQLKYRDQMEELKKTHNQILQADKLTILGELTANISHEINNPLTIAAGHSEIIRDMLSLPPMESRTAHIKMANKTVLEAIERVNQIIKNMKDFLHQSEDQKEYCDLESMVETAIEWIQPTAKKAGVRINKDMKDKRTVALANRIKLEQVIINLIKNSIDALKDAQVANAEITIRLSKSLNDRQTFIDVIDNGPGLNKELKENPFKPFQSTKSAGQGTGLGLSICAKILDAHKGKLQYVDTDSGCQFRMRLPLIETYSYTRNDRSLMGSQVQAQKRILVVDNEVQILNVLNAFINEAGYVFIGSSDPLDALGFLQKANVDLIITDFSMPEMDGGAFAKLTRENGYEGTLLYMTSAKHIEQYNKDKKDLDIGGLIIKPFNKDEVMKSIRLALKPKDGTHDS